MGNEYQSGGHCKRVYSPLKSWRLPLVFSALLDKRISQKRPVFIFATKPGNGEPACLRVTYLTEKHNPVAASNKRGKLTSIYGSLLGSNIDRRATAMSSYVKLPRWDYLTVRSEQGAPSRF